MKIRLDAHFIIGNSHTVCEDYAKVAYLPNTDTYVAIVSDGCSSASNTDVGSRIVSLAALKAIENGYDKHTFREIFLLNLAEFSSMLGLQHELTATIMIAIVQDNQLIVLVQGDGVIYVEHEDHSELATISFSENAPAYPFYSIDDDMIEQFNDMNQKCTITTNNNVQISNANANDFTLIRTYNDISKIKKVVLFSDGIESFKQNNQSINMENIYKSIIDFKNVKAGSFAIRKLTRLQKEWALNKITHEDDLSIASIVFDMDAENA